MIPVLKPKLFGHTWGPLTSPSATVVVYSRVWPSAV